VFLCHIQCMDTLSLQTQLAACIQAALEQHKFARPATPDTSVTDAYASMAAAVVVNRLIAAGWICTNQPGDWDYGQ
jgi:hypothetical protein